MVNGQELLSPVKVNYQKPVHRCSCIYSTVTFLIFVNIAKCKIEDATKNEKVRVEPVSSQYVQDDQIIIVCDSGYHVVNSSDPILVRVCLSDRTWSGMDPHCEKSTSRLISIQLVTIKLFKLPSNLAT